MTWLARMEIDAETAFESGVPDSYSWHQRLWQCFPGQPDRKRDFLTRVDTLDGAFRLWLLSPHRPSCPTWCPRGCFAVKEIAESLLSHRYYAFDLRANAVKCLVQRNERGERNRHGKRVPLTKPEDLRDWIDRKGQQGGFRIVGDRPLEIGPMVKSHFRKQEQAACHGGVEFRGVLEVIDRRQFKETYNTGIGSAKGFGFGLLLLAPVNL
ncbi:MAG: type I-E CRISPR-associated protein Cas6/Cse3/CasE [Pirellulaceae bacterium]